LKDQEIPFYNPYRTTNGRWNPLSESLQKIRAFSKPKRWNGRQASSWAINLKSDGVFHRGKKKEFLDLCEHREKDLLYSEDLKEYFMEYSLERLLSRDLSMFSEFGVRSSPSWNYGLSIVKRYGIDVEPKIIVGTIHSVKGGEADHVYVAPDLSRAGWEEYTGQHRDRVIRLFYVAMTRARESLTLLDTLHYRRIEW
jgi:superfamily I DNA/RNA helicase